MRAWTLRRGPTCAGTWNAERGRYTGAVFPVLSDLPVTDPVPDPDPRPLPPEEPGPNECCGSGCPLCVLDLYSEELQRYRKALAEWQARHPQEAP